MAAMAHYPWRPLGELLVEKALLHPDELDAALLEQHRTGRLLGQLLVEMGFMTNRTDDRLLATTAYQRRAAVGLCRGTLRFLGRSPARC